MQGNTLKLDIGKNYYFNFQNITINEAGDYRVYADLQDENGYIINATSGLLNNSWEFNVIECLDSDGDKYNIIGGICGAVDCNDEDSLIFPKAEEICENEIDEDCDGRDELCPYPDVKAYIHYIGDAVVGEEKHIETTIYSNGIGDAYNISASLYESGDYWNGNKWAENLSLINASKIDFIATGYSRGINFTFTPIESRWYKLKLFVNVTNDKDPENNIFYGSFRARANASDVTGRINFYTVAIVNETNSIPAEIYNDGLLDAMDVNAALYESTYLDDSGFIENLILVDSEFIGLLQSSSYIEVNFSWIPKEQKNYRLKLVTEAKNDSNTNNNNHTIQIEAKIKGADLYAYLINFDRAIFNASKQVDYIIYNSGSEDALNAYADIFQLTNGERFWSQYGETNQITYKSHSIIVTPYFFGLDNVSVNMTVDNMDYIINVLGEGVYPILENLSLWINYINYDGILYNILAQKQLGSLSLGVIEQYSETKGNFSWTPDTLGANYLFIKVDADNEINPRGNYNHIFIEVQNPGPDISGRINYLSYRAIVNETIDLEIYTENIGTETAENVQVMLYDLEDFVYIHLEKNSSYIFSFNGTEYLAKLITINGSYIEINFTYGDTNETLIFEKNKASALQNGNMAVIDYISSDFVVIIVGTGPLYARELGNIDPQNTVLEHLAWTPHLKGNHRLITFFNASNDVNWENNYQSDNVRVVSSGPDISVYANDIWDRLFIVNQPQEISVELNNYGTQNAENINVLFYEIAYGEEGEILTLLDSRIIAELGIDKNVMVNLSYTPYEIGYRDFKIAAFVENEADYNNNEFYFGKYVSSNQSDLRVYLSADEIAIVNETQTVKAFIENKGVLPAYSINVTLMDNANIINSSFVDILENEQYAENLHYTWSWIPLAVGIHNLTLAALSENGDYNIADNTFSRQVIAAEEKNVSFTITNSTGKLVERELFAINKEAIVNMPVNLSVADVIGLVAIGAGEDNLEEDNFFATSFINSSLNENNNVISEVYYNIIDGRINLIAVFANKINWQYSNKTEASIIVRSDSLNAVQNLSDLTLLACSYWDFNNKVCRNKWQEANINYKKTAPELRAIHIEGYAN